jgi:orotate phosphoribosyltransferase
MPTMSASDSTSELQQRHRARLLELLTRLSYEQREVTLSSGQKSNFYIDCKQTVLGAEGHFLVGSLFLRVIQDRAPEVEAVGGLTMGADPLASAVSTMSYLSGRPLHAFYVRKEAKGHGTGQWLEGVKGLRPGMPVAILEDVVTTGGSAMKAIVRAREFGLRVALIVGLVDREEGGREALEREAPLVTLYRRQDFG